MLSVHCRVSLAYKSELPIMFDIAALVSNAIGSLRPGGGGYSMIKQLIGETKVMFAMKKGTSIGNSLVQNKAICLKSYTDSSNQKCGAPGCLQCPLVNLEHRLTINKTNISIPTSLNCKSRSVVYLWKCSCVKQTNSISVARHRNAIIEPMDTGGVSVLLMISGKSLHYRCILGMSMVATLTWKTLRFPSLRRYPPKI